MDHLYARLELNATISMLDIPFENLFRNLSLSKFCIYIKMEKH